MNIGKMIKLFRTAADYSQKEFAKRIGVSPSYLSLIERGLREPRISLLKDVARVLEIPISALFLEADDSSQNLAKRHSAEYERLQVLTLEMLKSMLTHRPSSRANGAD